SFGVLSLTGSSKGGGGADIHGYYTCWFNDSRHWVDIDDRRALIHDVYAPDQVETVPIPRTSLLLLKSLHSQDGLNVRCLSKSLFVAHTDLHRYDEMLHGVLKVDIYAGRLDADAQHTRRYIFRAPAGYRIFDAV